jgi:hypothetical protein
MTEIGQNVELTPQGLETSAANAHEAMVTANFFAAYSTDAGATFTSTGISPQGLMSLAGDTFCCDQRSLLLLSELKQRLSGRRSVRRECALGTPEFDRPSRIGRRMNWAQQRSQTICRGVCNRASCITFVQFHRDVQDDGGTAVSLEIKRRYDGGVIGLGIFSVDGKGG